MGKFSRSIVWSMLPVFEHNCRACSSMVCSLLPRAHYHWCQCTKNLDRSKGDTSGVTAVGPASRVPLITHAIIQGFCWIVCLWKSRDSSAPSASQTFFHHHVPSHHREDMHSSMCQHRGLLLNPSEQC